MSALTEAANDELEAHLLAQNNIIDGLSLVISRQQAVMRQALEAMDAIVDAKEWMKTSAVRKALRNSLEGQYD